MSVSREYSSSSGYIELSSEAGTLFSESRTKSFEAGKDGDSRSDRSNWRNIYCLSLRSESLVADDNDDDDEGTEEDDEGGPDLLPPEINHIGNIF